MRRLLAVEGIRARASRSGVRAPAVGPFDELHGEDRGDGQRELGESLVDVAVGVAAELTEVRQPAVGPLHGPTHPEWDRQLLVGRATLALPRAHHVIEAQVCAERSGDAVVVAAVEVQGLDVNQEPAAIDRVKGGLQQDAVVAVRSALFPADRDSVSVGRDRPLPATLASISGVRAGALATEGSLVLGPVDRDLGQIEGDDLVVGVEGFLDETLEQPGIGPLVEPTSQRRLGALAEPTSDIPGTAGDEQSTRANPQPSGRPVDVMKHICAQR